MVIDHLAQELIPYKVAFSARSRRINDYAKGTLITVNVLIVTGSWLQVFMKISVCAGRCRCFKEFLFLFTTKASTHHWANRPLIY